MTTAERRWRGKVASQWIAHRVAHRAYIAHLTDCLDCEWDLCAEGKRLGREADERRAALPYNARRVVRQAEADEPESRVPMLAAFAVAALAASALFWLPLILAFWRFP
jgi:hypothetical protein